MPWPFDREYMQLALAAGLAVGLSAPLVGTFLVQRRMSLLGDGIGHLAFAGVAAGLVMGTSPTWTAIVVATLGAVAMEHLRRRGSAQSDVALAVMFYGGIAGGAVLMGRADAGSTSVLSYLFGSILTVERSEVVLVVAMGLLISATVALSHRGLFAIAVDEEWSKVAGLPVGLLDTVFAVLTALTVVTAMRVVGILLVAALMVLPVASAQRSAASQRAIMAVSSALGMFAVIVGLSIARWLGLAPGGTIVLVSVGTFLVFSVVRWSRGEKRYVGEHGHHVHGHHGHGHHAHLHDGGH